MLKWINSRVDGAGKVAPINAKQAKKLIADLPLSDATQSLNIITTALESLVQTGNPRTDEYVETVQLLDEAGQHPKREMTRDYLTSNNAGASNEVVLWQANYQFNKVLSEAYLASLAYYESGGKVSAMQKRAVAIQALRSLAKQLKWQCMRYDSDDGEIWQAMARVYIFAVHHRFHKEKLNFYYPAVPGETSVEEEYLKALMLAVSSPDSLSPEDMAIAERIILYFSPGFVLEPTNGTIVHYCIDLAEAKRPSRLMPLTLATPTLRLFGAAGVAGGLEKLRQQVKRGKVPPEIDLGSNYTPAAVLRVIDHLAPYWSKELPVRKSSRRKVNSALSIVHGYESILFSVTGLNAATAKNSSSWIAQNISDYGVGAVIPNKDNNIRIGRLLGVRTASEGQWGVGVVRRVTRDRQQQARVGIELLAQTMEAVQLRTTLHDAAAANEKMESAALLGGGGRYSGGTLLLLKRGLFSTIRSAEMHVQGEKRMLAPVNILEDGEDYELVQFKEVQEATLM